MHWPIRHKIALNIEGMEIYVGYISAEFFYHFYLPTSLFYFIFLFLFQLLLLFRKLNLAPCPLDAVD